MTKPNAENTAQGFIEFSSRFRVPRDVLTDSGINFVSRTIKELFNCLQIKNNKSSPYRPQTNGMVL